MLGLFAVDWLMSELAALEAEVGAALALNFDDVDGQVGSLAAHIALGIWAPFDVLIIIGVVLTEPLPVSLLDSRAVLKLAKES
mmetsp:Transcript_28241/g.37687  ORF Transcript_28241/g.37687 Transcript_28241/m.37687 type:complete len:83 (+) Transcript_28241:871-1119(+)